MLDAEALACLADQGPDAENEYDLVRYPVANSPSGERLSTMQFSWHWDDNPDCPIKYRSPAVADRHRLRGHLHPGPV